MATYHTAAQLNLISDKLTAAWLAAKGTAASGLGIGDNARGHGLELKVANLSDLIDGTTDASFRDIEQQALIVAQTKAAYDAALLDSMFRSVLQRFYTAWSNMSANASGLSSTIVSLDTYLTYLNVTHATKWQALCAPDFRDAFYAMAGAHPSVQNVYFEIVQGATYANALRKLVVGTGQTAGASVDTTKYCGGFPKLVVSGFAGSADTVTVTGTQYDPATKTATAGKTWTVSVTGNGTFTLAPGGGTPAATDSLIAAVTSIVAGANITASTTIYAEAQRPSGRTNPPT